MGQVFGPFAFENSPLTSPSRQYTNCQTERVQMDRFAFLLELRVVERSIATGTHTTDGFETV